MVNDLNMGSTLLSKELELLIRLVRIEDIETVHSENQDYFTEIDWNRFLKLAIYHRVYPLIYLKLKNIGENLIPLYIIQALEKEYKMNILKMLHLSGEMEKISKLFTDNGIQVIFLKGPVVAYNLYGDISLRTSKDLDILIQINDLEKAENLLLSFGYRREGIQNILNDWKWKHYHITYFNSQKGIQVEIHWRLHPRPLKEPSFDELWERRKVSKINSELVFILGEEDLFVYLLVHGARHGWFRLRWLIDIDRILRKKLNWKTSNLLLKEYKYHYLGGQALILTSQLLRTPIVKEIQSLLQEKHSKKLAKQAILYLIEPKDSEITSGPLVKGHVSYLFSLMSNIQKISFALILLYPSSKDAMVLRLPKDLHFLYFPLRPFLWIWRKIRKSK